MERDVQSELDPRKSDDIHNTFSLTFSKNQTDYGATKKKVQLMGILNCTPDSFYDGGLFFACEKAIERGLEMIKEGANIIDIGGESTRPNAIPVSIEEELKRVLPVVSELAKKNIPLSIDTSKPKVAEKAIECGVQLLNDVCGFKDLSMQRIAAESRLPICVMHMQGTPQTMQLSPSYPKGIIVDLKEWFEKRIEELLKNGIQEKQIILDPGIGFGKTLAHTIEILKNLSIFSSIGFPLLIGLSRKSFLSKILGKQPTELLSTTLALNTMSILEGASIIRVHDVKEHRNVIDTLAFFQ